MYSFYADQVMARSMAKERISKREFIQLGSIQNPLHIIDNLIENAVNYVKSKLQEPELLPVYCFEYAPSC